MRTNEGVNVNYIQKATRLSLYKVADSVGEIRFGQHFHLNEDQEWEYADGTKKSYPTILQRYSGVGFGVQGQLLEGRDEVSSTKMLTVLVSNFEISTHAYDKAETYQHGAALAITDGGLIVPFDSGAHKTEFIIGYVTGVPEDEEDFLTYQG